MTRKTWKARMKGKFWMIQKFYWGTEIRWEVSTMRADMMGDILSEVLDRQWKLVGGTV